MSSLYNPDKESRAGAFLRSSVPERKIPIFFTFDKNYCVPAAVNFFSLLNKTKPGVFWEMFVLHSDIDRDSEQKIRKCLSGFFNYSLSFINTENFLKTEWQKGNWDGHQFKRQFTSDAVCRCFGARFFPQYDKIIYSDVDVIFTEDVSRLIDTDLKQNYLAAVKNPFLKYSRAELSHLSPEHYEKFKNTYFAGGIWILNLKKIRESDLEKRMLEIIEDNAVIKKWPDQDIMNIACDNRVTYLPLNYISYPYLLDLIKSRNFISHYSENELYDSILNPKIIHYAAGKPWQGKSFCYEPWYAVYYSLKLDLLFPDFAVSFTKSEVKKLKKNIRKYKKLFLFASVLCAVSAAVVIFLL